MPKYDTPKIQNFPSCSPEKYSYVHVIYSERNHLTTTNALSINIVFFHTCLPCRNWDDLYVSLLQIFTLNYRTRNHGSWVVWRVIYSPKVKGQSHRCQIMKGFCTLHPLVQTLLDAFQGQRSHA